MSATDHDRIRTSSGAYWIIHGFFGFIVGIRFLLHSRSRWVEVQSWSSNPEHSPLPPDFYPAQQWMLAGASLVIASVFIAMMVAHTRGGLFLSGIFDVILSAVLITAAKRQLSHIPASQSGCYPYQGPQSIQDMFVGLAKEQENKNAGDICTDYHGSWVYALVMSLATIPGALIGIFAPNEVGIAIVTIHLWIIPTCLVALGAGAWLALCYLWQRYIGPFLYFVTTPLRAILFILGRIPSVSRYRDRRAEKLQRKLKQGGGDIDLEEQLLPAIDFYERKRDGPKLETDSMSIPVSSGVVMKYHGSSPTFEGVFSQERPLRELLSHCHFEDAWRLCHTSKTLRLAISEAGMSMIGGPHIHQSSPLPPTTAMRIMTCWQGSKSACWGCGIQTCTGCSTAVVVPNSMAPRTTPHLTLCEARCVACYVGKMCSSKSSSTRSQPCEHQTHYTRASASATIINKREHATTSANTIERWKPEFGSTRMLCSGCAAMTAIRLREKREEGEKKELDWLARSTVTCGDCQLLLEENGPRFWACCKCGAECTSDFHPPWRGKPDDPRMAHLQPLSALVKGRSIRSTS